MANAICVGALTRSAIASEAVAKASAAPPSIPVEMACSRVARASSELADRRLRERQPADGPSERETGAGDERSGVRRPHAPQGGVGVSTCELEMRAEALCEHLGGGLAGRFSEGERAFGVVGQQCAVGRRPWPEGADKPVPRLQLEVPVRLAEGQRLVDQPLSLVELASEAVDGGKIDGGDDQCPVTAA